MRILRYLAVVFVVAAAAVPIHTQASQDLALLYGQQCVAEISLALRQKVAKPQRVRNKIEECNLMWSILRDRADRAGVSEPWMIRQYNTLFKREDSWRHYILHLTPTTMQPERWPSTMDWQVYRTTWSRIYASAQKFVAVGTRHPCPKANHFGGRCDDDDHACDERPCWERQWCGRPKEWFAQAYYKARACKPPQNRSKAIPAWIAAGK